MCKSSAAISICLEMAIDPEIILSGLRQFKGVVGADFKGETDGITIIDDYGHHPVEIRAALSAGRMQNKISSSPLFSPIVAACAIYFLIFLPV